MYLAELKENGMIIKLWFPIRKKQNKIHLDSFEVFPVHGLFINKSGAKVEKMENMC